MLFGADGLANFYLGCFLFGLIFTSISLFLNFAHLGVGHTPAAHGPGQVLNHAGHAVHGPHVGAHGPAAPGQGHASAGEQLDGLSPFNLPTILAFITWFGGAGYIFHTTFGLGPIVTAALAIVSGLGGSAVVFFILSYVLWRGQTPPLRRADYYLPGTHARVVSRIGAGGVGEIAFQKGGGRRVEGARNETGEALERGTEVVITRYDKGLAYVQPAIIVTEIPTPAVARVEELVEPSTQPLSSGPAYTRDLSGR